MKINIEGIPPEGRVLEEEIDPTALDLGTDLIHVDTPVKARAVVKKITETITVDLDIDAVIIFPCSRCVKDYREKLHKSVHLSFSPEKGDRRIDLDPEIRDNIILEYPIKPLCSADCRGLCLACGKNLNEGQCGCGRGK